MFKIKKILSGCLAAVMLLTMSITAFATADTYDGVAYGNYTVEVSCLKTSVDESSGMAGYMATNILPVTVDAKGYTLTLDFHNYWPADGSAAMEDLKYDVDGDWVSLNMVDVSDAYEGTNYERAIITTDSLGTILLQAYIPSMEGNSYASPVQSWRVVPEASTLTAVVTAPFVPTADGYYTANNVAVMNHSKPESYSMCNGIFAGEADVTINGDWATLHIYVANPTPGSFGGVENGVLTESYITYAGQNYNGQLTSIGYENDSAAVKLFTQDSSFFGIDNGESYACDTLQFTIPTAALASNIEISAVVNLVMNGRNAFLLDINWLQGDNNGDNSQVTNQSMNVTATVAKNVSTSSVVIPASTNMGELSKTKDTVVNYTVDIKEGVGQTVAVTADESVTMTSNDATLTITNDFDGKNGTLTASAEAVAAVASYEGDLDFSGSLSFTITVA